MPSRFKYYIHDSIESCRLELIGDLTAAEVIDLKGCWTTARTTLGSRKLIIDLRKLTSTDAEGSAWIEAMSGEGAEMETAKSHGEEVRRPQPLLDKLFGRFGRRSYVVEGGAQFTKPVQ